MDGNLTKKIKIMKHSSIFFNLICLTFVCSFISCEDNRDINIPNDKIYLLKSGLNEQQIFNWPNYTYELVVMKSGNGKAEGELELTVNPNILLQYNDSNNTNYELLPEDMYTIKNKILVVKANDYRVSFEIGMKTSEITALQAETQKIYALPCKVSTLRGNFDLPEEEKLISIIIPHAQEPYIEFIETGLLNPVTIDLRSESKIMFFSEVRINYNNMWNIDFAVAAEKNMVDSFNATHLTNYQALPEAAYQIDPTSLSMPKHANRQPIKITFLKQGFIDNSGQYMFGNYLLPLKLVSVSKNNINPEKDVQFLPVSFNPLLFDRSEWLIVGWNSSAHEEGYNRLPEHLLDGNTTTFWGSKWDKPKPLPYYIIFDMRKEQTVHRIDLIKPTGSQSWRGNIKAGYFEISNDNESWKKMSDWQIEDNAAREHQFIIKGSSKGRYIKFVITEAFSYMNPQLGPESGAQCNLAEFIVWGE